VGELLREKTIFQDSSGAARRGAARRVWSSKLSA